MSLLRSARRTGLARGIIDGNRTWLVIGGAAWALRGLQYALRPEPPTVYRTEIKVGETYVISEQPAPPTRRERRRARRDVKRMTAEELRRAEKQTRRDARRSRRARR
jgi:hypothetical protein